MATTTPPFPSDPRTPDFRRRVDPALLPERMDGPCSYEDFRACVRDIGSISRITLAYGPIRHFVHRVLKQHGSARPLEVVDVGSGGGDVLRHLGAWARRSGHRLRLTGIDLNAYATRAAQEFTAQAEEPALNWITGDVFTHPQIQSPDLVLSSLVTHHMADEEIVRFLQWMEGHAALGWFISDLLRSKRSFQLFRQLSRVARWHSFVQHDGLVSVQRAFREEDWKRLLGQAGIPLESVAIRRAALGRLCLTRVR